MTNPSADDARPATAGRAPAPESDHEEANGSPPLLRLAGRLPLQGRILPLHRRQLRLRLGQVCRCMGMLPLRNQRLEQEAGHGAPTLRGFLA